MTTRISDPAKQALSAYRSGDFGAAESFCKNALQSDSGQVELILMLSGLLIRRNALDEAASLLAEALKTNPGEPRVNVNFGIVLDKLGDHDRAVNFLKPVTESNPELLSAWNALAAALLSCNHAEEAERVLKSGLQYHPESPVLTLHLARAKAMAGQSDSAMRVYADFSRMSGQLVQEAESLAQSGQFGEAELLYRQVLKVQESNSLAYAGLGRLLLRMGRDDEAKVNLERALIVNPSDATSRHFLRAIGPACEKKSDPAYVRNLFDAYADDFERSLTHDLDYCVPNAIQRLLSSMQIEPLEILDLGCGTGLVGVALNGYEGDIDGIDLSASMLAKAKEKGRYRKLTHGEIVDFLQRSSDFWDLVVAADVLIYVGDVKELFSAVERRLRPDGRFCFSVESCDMQDIELHPGSGRFRHSDAYLQQCLEVSGLVLERVDDLTLRTEFGKGIKGKLLLARKS